MAQVDLIMPKMGESIMEATILKWLKKAGDRVELDESILEIATDKVDSEIPSPVEGVISEILFQEDETVPVGTVIAKIQTVEEGKQPEPSPSVEIEKPEVKSRDNGHEKPQPVKVSQPVPANQPPGGGRSDISRTSPDSGRFYSPLVRNIARQEGISMEELDTIPGTGLNQRVTKNDVLAYLESGRQQPVKAPESVPQTVRKEAPAPPPPASKAVAVSDDHVEIIEMGRMRKLIADHMVMSKQTSPHVTSFVEVDVTPIVQWRNGIKQAFQEKYGEKITYTPIFVQAVVQALQDFPMVNISVSENKIIRKKDLNIGMATALPSGNLIVPVIKNADRLNLLGLTKTVNDLAQRARENKLLPEEIQDGTFTLTNVGTFGNVMGTPIINQPQVAILATGAIRKKPAVVETEYGDLIAVRQMMFLSLSYDHRVVDGFLGGSFLRRVGDYLEAFDPETRI